MGEPTNIFEDILYSFLERSLGLKFDICTCQQCKKKMMRYLLPKFLPYYISVDNPKYQDIQLSLIRRHSKRIFYEVKNAIDEVSKNMPHPLEEDKDKAFEHLLRQIKKDRGIDLSQYFKTILKRRVALRMVAAGVSSYMDYLKILSTDCGEYEKLFTVLTINVSDFFRDPPVWIKIKEILALLTQRSSQTKKPLTIWSAGCAKGEEPYSMAMLINELNTEHVPTVIHATDVDQECLAQARVGAYEGRTVDRAIENAEKEKALVNALDYFILKDYKYYIKDEIRTFVKFSYLDLTSMKYIENVDMIVCRNVFIYFTKPLQEQILDKFYRALNEGGYLIIGQSETLPPEAKSVFRTIDSLTRIFQKLPT